MPSVVSQSGSTKATYTYLADGSKVQVADASGNGFAYLGSLIYTKSGSGYTLENARFSSGRIQNSSGILIPYYYTTDHLGSVRLVTNSGGAVAEQNDYFPFGGKHTSGQPYSTLAANRYKFNGKEEQTVGGLSYLDYGARIYDNVLGRWMTQDPLGEEQYWANPYNYVQNNPINRIDPTGLIDDWVEDKEKRIYWDKKAKSQATTKQGERYLGAAVIVFNGSMNEKLGEGDNLFGKGAVLADVTVYGPKGADDVKDYKGFTMSSDQSSYGVVADGDYFINKLMENEKPGPYNSVWTLNKRGKVPDTLQEIPHI